MSFKFNSQTFEVVEKNGVKTVSNKKKDIDDAVKDYWEKTREETFSYRLLSLLNTDYGRELVAKAQEAMRIEHFVMMHNLDGFDEKVRENIFKCFKEIDDFLKEDFDIKVNKDSSYSFGKAYVEPIPTGEKKTYSEASVGGVTLF